MTLNPLEFARLLAAVRSAEQAVDYAHEDKPDGLVDEATADNAVRLDANAATTSSRSWFVTPMMCRSRSKPQTARWCALLTKPMD